MADKLYPLVFKPGILRDGTPFQGEYCTDGQWVRWQRGNVRKIGGMQAFNVAFPAPDLAIPAISTTNSIFYLLQQSNSDLLAYIVYNTTIKAYKFTAFLKAGNEVNINANNQIVFTGNDLCQILPVNTPTGKELLFFTAKNYLTNINSTDAGTLCTIKTVANAVLIQQNILTDNTSLPIPTIPSGGACYSDPYLFLYGSSVIDGVTYEGVVLCSGVETINALPVYNIFNFKKLGDDTQGGRRIIISTDKVIYGTPVRGGQTSPTILFWTLSSVVRISNVSDTGKVNFRKDVISQSCSIMSSRCIVEYDGLFFWSGTDRFFVYNGQVQEISNVMNLNYFFDNVDMNKRQLVYGVPNLKYGEIWWFYPEKMTVNAQGILVPNLGGCTRAVIFNVRENTWYDTAIARDSGMLLESDGGMYTFGLSLANPLNPNKYLWKHEVATNEVIPLPPVVQRILGGAASSNTGLTNDNAAGGNPQNAFTDPPDPNKFYVQNRNTNLMYDYGVGNFQTISQIQVIRSNINGTTTIYHIVVQKSSDLMNWTTIVDDTSDVPPNIRNPIVKSFNIANPTPARAFRLLSDNNPLLNSSSINAFGLNGVVNQNAINLGIPSSFTTPIFSWSSFSPLKQNDGIDRSVQLKRIEPDMKVNDPKEEQKFVLTINTQIYAQSKVYSTTILQFTGGTPKIDYRAQGRQMSFTISSTNFFEMGHWFMLLSVGDGR